MILSIGREWKAGKVSYPEQEASKKTKNHTHIDAM